MRHLVVHPDGSQEYVWRDDNWRPEDKVKDGLLVQCVVEVDVNSLVADKVEEVEVEVLLPTEPELEVVEPTCDTVVPEGECDESGSNTVEVASEADVVQ